MMLNFKATQTQNNISKILKIFLIMSIKNQIVSPYILSQVNLDISLDDVIGLNLEKCLASRRLFPLNFLFIKIISPPISLNQLLIHIKLY